MAVTLIIGPARSGKTAALRERCLHWLQQGVRTDQILILTHGAEQTAPWRRGLDLPASGAIEVHDFYGFVRQELTLHWPTVQAQLPPARRWLAPVFLPLTVERHLLQALLEPYYTLFGDVVKTTPERLAMQLLTRVDRAAAAAGIAPGQAVRRMAEADRPEKRLVYSQVAALLEQHRTRLLASGLLDYGLALTLFSETLLPDPGYRAFLRGRFCRLLVDDLEEAAPAERAFIAAMAEAVEEAVLTIDPDGGHGILYGSAAAEVLARFAGADRVVLPDPAPDLDARLAQIREAQAAAGLAAPLQDPSAPSSAKHGPSAAQRGLASSQPGPVAAQQGLPAAQQGPPQERSGQDRHAQTSSLTSGSVHLAAEFWGDMVARAAEAVADLAAEGLPPGEIAVIAPRVDHLLATALGQALAARGIPLQPVVPTRRLLDEPAVRAVVVLAGLAVPAWRPPWPSPSPYRDAVRVLLGLDPIAAAHLGEALWAAEGDLPDPADHPAPYRLLYAWLRAARRKTWQTDTFIRAVLLELLLPLRPVLPAAAVDACRQLLRVATDFRLAAQRLAADCGMATESPGAAADPTSAAHRPGAAGDPGGTGPFGRTYRPLLTEATSPLWPGEAEGDGGAVLLATPQAYLSRRLTSTVQVWLDVSAPGWRPAGVSELANPHVLDPAWPEGAPWTDDDARRVREAARDRIVRALLRRCTGRVITASAALSPWVQEQEGGLWA